jgi:hypothetical protein
MFKVRPEPAQMKYLLGVSLQGRLLALLATHFTKLETLARDKIFELNTNIRNKITTIKVL